MSIDLDRDLRRYVSYLDSITTSAVEPFEVEILAAGDREHSLVEPKTHRRALLVQPRRWVWAVGAAVVVGLLVGGAAWLTRSRTVDPAVAAGDALETTRVEVDGDGFGGLMVETGDAVWIVEGRSITRIDAATREATRSMEVNPVKGDIVDLVWDGEVIWAMSALGEKTIYELEREGDLGFVKPGAVTRIDVSRRLATNVFEFGAPGESWFTPRLLIADGALWVVHSDGFERIDLSTLQVDSIAYPVGSGDPWSRGWMGEADGALWLDDVFRRGPRRLIRIDLATREVEEISVPIETGLVNIPVFSALGDGAVWFVKPGEVARFDLESRELTTLPMGVDAVLSGVYADGAFWVPSSPGGMKRIDGSSLEVADIPSPFAVWSQGPVVAAGGFVWSTSMDGSVVLIDTTTRKVTHVVSLGDSPSELLAFDGAVWAASNGDPITRIEYP